ncbi:uncharacterized protein CYBJADRAFT_132334 [Cyberlindnera jadinii NRRL Y-1542]|uniref:Zn(2)-C6 fungal-type domain-containing protein n=1 Tax=Cyberlindnera jadinii (strain ATCC 18201 / CBS 1600 / BCRC 20928 / JCM 3617 / NBRC 0987 / NRRL Y-1542) TaxID=983966 RepID=A0A1E4RUW8_CYBJN|nr:hypothetical protein CYBJADRAFT_132334 [Cyberlindnera jadinii NRRL Y-1542]ODV71077.1 hypothetical protein CYBJADRAFT_132334 [Cyberlindnera jadinii NRRL Y-1542]
MSKKDIEGTNKKRTRSRFGCHRCKRLKVKCDEMRPSCSACVKSGKECDYSIKLTWGGRPFKKPKTNNLANGTIDSTESMSSVGTFETKQPGIDDLEPLEKDRVESSSPGNGRYVSLDDDHRRDDFMVAFKDMQTPNELAKQFLNDSLLPELNEFNHLIFHEDTDSSPENLTIMETSHIFSGEASHQLPMLTKPKFTGFEIIPEVISPLPDILLHNDLYKEHYHKYVEIYSKLLCPAAPRTYTDNPFTCLLPRLSLSSGSDGLLAMLISFSLAQDATHKGDPYPMDTVGLLLNRALDDLYRRLTDPQEANSDYTLCLILVLSCFEIICDRNPHGWRAHYYGARKIIFSRGLLRATTSMMSERKRVAYVKGSEADLEFFFQRWFAYLDVIGSLSSASSAYSSNRPTNIIWECPVPTREDREKLTDIDPFTGFDMRLLEYFSYVVNLVHQRETSGTVDGETLPLDLIQKALEVKERLLNYLKETEADRDAIERTLQEDAYNVLNEQLEDYRLLRATNRVFALSCVLQIYRRVLLMPRDTTLVQNLVSEIIASIRNQIPQQQPAACCTFFSLFSSGCEALADEDRLFYLARIDALINVGIRNAMVAKDVMLESWETGKYWADILSERGMDIIFV